MTEQFTFAGFSFPRQPARLVTRRDITPAMRKARDRFLESFRSGRTSPYATMPYVFKVDTAYRVSPQPNGKGLSFYLDSDFQPGLRWQWCDKVEGVGRSIDHEGWFTDDHQDSTIRGIVFRLPHGRGFLAGCSMGEGMITDLDSRIHESERDAAFYADDLARYAAEKERDYQAAWQEGIRAAEFVQQADGLDSEIVANRAELISLTSERRRLLRMPNLEIDVPFICNRLVRDIRGLLATIRELRAERDELRDKADALRTEWRGSDGFGDGLLSGGV